MPQNDAVEAVAQCDIDGLFPQHRAGIIDGVVDAEGQRLRVQQRQVVSAESIAKFMFDTGLKVARSKGLLDVSVSPGEMAARRQAHADDMRTINRRVRALRSLASARRSGVVS